MKVVDRLPFTDASSEVWTPDGLVAVKPYQIIVMVALAVRERIDVDGGLSRFPAILDTGMNHNFAIREQQLRTWAQIPSVEPRHHVTVQGRRVPLINASLWLFGNERASTTVSDRAPIRLPTPEGIAVFPGDAPNPARLPVHGLRALVRNDLTLIMNGKRREVTLKTPGWF